jgi:hypothetical protein
MQQPEEKPSLNSQLGDKTETQTLAFQAPGWPQAATLTIAAVATDPLAPYQRQTGKRSITGIQADSQGNHIKGVKDETVEGKRRSLAALADVSRAKSRWKRVSAEGSDMNRGPPRRLQQTKLHFPPDSRVAERQPVSAQSYRKCSHGQSCDLGHKGAPAKRVIREGGHRFQVNIRKADDHDEGARAEPLGGYEAEVRGGRLCRHKVQRHIPDNIWEAQRTLKDFDWSVEFGPRLSLTRTAQFNRRRRLSALAGWGWVDDLLKRFPELGYLKPFDQYQGQEQIGLLLRPTRLVLRDQHTHIPGHAPVSGSKSMSSVTTDQIQHLRKAGSGERGPQPSSTSTLQNIGSTCFFNSALQVIASIPVFVEELKRTFLR